MGIWWRRREAYVRVPPRFSGGLLHDLKCIFGFLTPRPPPNPPGGTRSEFLRFLEGFNTLFIVFSFRYERRGSFTMPPPENREPSGAKPSLAMQILQTRPALTDPTLFFFLKLKRRKKQLSSKTRNKWSLTSSTPPLYVRTKKNKGKSVFFPTRELFFPVGVSCLIVSSPLFHSLHLLSKSLMASQIQLIFFK